MTVGGSGSPVEARTAEVREMYASLLKGDLSGTDALAASQQMLQILMDSMANAVFWKDLNSCYLGCNKVFARFAGVEPSLLIGMSDRDMPWADSESFSADWFMGWDRTVMETGDPVFGIVEQLRSAAGEDRWLQTNKVPLRDLDGRIIGVLGTFEDITDRRRTEEQLQRTLDELDERVQQRTAELVLTNESLRREVEDRVRLQAEERQQRAYAEALRDTAAAVTSTLDLQGVLREVVVGVQRVVSADLIAVILVDSAGGGELASHRASFGYGPLHLDRLAADPSQLSILRRLAVDEGPIIINEPMDAIGAAGSVLGARISVADHVLGYVFAESAVHGFYTASHAERLAAVADQAGAAVSNTRLAGRASELAAAEERQRLAGELHDAVNQTLWTAALTAESVLRDIDASSPLWHRVARLHQLTKGALSEMRALLLELRPDDLTKVSLGELIRSLVTALECRRTLDVEVDVAEVRLDPTAHHTFYRVAQEALRNVTQHAEASAVRLSLVDGPVTELVISDDGRGFDEAAVPSGHLGLAIMRERAESIGASLVVSSTFGSGTTVRLRLAALGALIVIRVVIVDDHDLLREGVTACLSARPDIDVVAEASTGERAIALAATHDPDVVVIDMVMPGLGGLEAIRRLRAAHPAMGILALTSYAEGDRIRDALAAGANGYLVKSVDSESLAQAVRSVAIGQGTFSPEVTRVLACPAAPAAHAADLLTAREAEIAGLLASGRTNAEIARELALSVFTVKNHVSSILSKLHAQTRTEAAALLLTAHPDR